MTSDQGERVVSPTESETTRTDENLSRGSRETPVTSTASMAEDRSAEARCRTADMHVTGESGSSIVPEKLTNKTGPLPVAESVEERWLTRIVIHWSIRACGCSV